MDKVHNARVGSSQAGRLDSRVRRQASDIGHCITKCGDLQDTEHVQGVYICVYVYMYIYQGVSEKHFFEKMKCTTHYALAWGSV